MLKKYIKYFTNNPEGYWFKKKLFGWGWVPVRWQGWLVILIAIALAVAGIYIGETDDAPGAGGLGLLLALGILFAFGYWKGEKPRWTWGLPKDDGDSDKEGIN